MQIENLPEYLKDLKRLLKKYKTLESDLEDLIKVLKVRPKSNPPFSFEISGLGIKTCVIKVKKIASDSFKGKGVHSRLRLVYAYFETPKKIVLIELYYKNDKEKENEDRSRIMDNFQ